MTLVSGQNLFWKNATVKAKVEFLPQVFLGFLKMSRLTCDFRTGRPNFWVGEIGDFWPKSADFLDWLFKNFIKIFKIPTTCTPRR